MINYDLIVSEYTKCVQDKSRIYMIQNYLKTFDGTQRREVPFLLFPRQKELCKVLGYGNNSVCTTKYRQAGITTVSGGFIASEIVLADPEAPQTVLVLGNNLELAQQMLSKIRDFLMQFPLWMWGEMFVNDDKLDLMAPPPKRETIFKKCNDKEVIVRNGCRIVARSSGPDATRGISAAKWLILDEAAFIENGVDVFASALPVISVHGRSILISTPNGKDQLYYETCRRAKLKGTDEWNKFDLVEMKWYQDLRYNRFLEWRKKNEETGDYDIQKERVLDEMGNIEYNEEKWEQLIADGWSPVSPWYTKMCQQFNYNKQKIAQELDVSFLGSDSTVLDPDAIEMQTKLNVREPDPRYRDLVLDDVWIWKPPIEGHRYILAIDNSRGSSDDATAMEMIDIDGVDEDGMPIIEQVMEYNGKLTGDVVGELAYQYGLKYNEAFIVVEDIGGYGSATLLTLQNLKYKNLYYDDPSLKNYTDINDATMTKVTADGLPGFHCNSVRFQMLSNFANLVKTNQFKIRSKRVISELDTWIFKNGRIDHKDGCHDDTLTCLAMGLFVMQYSMNKRNECKAKDAAMLKALVSVNNRVMFDPNATSMSRNQENIEKTEKKYAPPMLYHVAKLNDNTQAAKYKANMWLFK